MKLMLANPRGFCAGVNMAIETVEQVLARVGAPLYVYHEIVHNRHVVQQFERRGVVFVDHINQVPENSTVVYSAHGVSPAIRALAADRGLTQIDATCPLVTKVHKEALRFASRNYHIILIGHAGHDEVVATVGEAPEAITIVQNLRDIAALKFQPDKPLAYLTQTTLSMDDAKVLIKALKERYPNIQGPPRQNICYATTNRQHAIRKLADRADLVIVVGSKNSSNSVRLTEIAENSGTVAYLVDDVSELNHHWFDNAQTVLLSAGASAPEHLVREIIEQLTERYDATLEEHTVTQEDMHFGLPKSLRQLAPKKSQSTSL